MIFDIKENPVVGYVNSNGQVRKAIVNGVSESGNPDLAVIKEVPDVALDENRAPGTYHLLSAKELAALQDAPASEVAEPSETPTVEVTAPESVNVEVSESETA